MILTSSNTLENKEIIEYKGLVTGESLIGSNIYKDIFSGVRDVVGGRTTRYEEELAQLVPQQTQEQSSFDTFTEDPSEDDYSDTKDPKAMK